MTTLTEYRWNKTVDELFKKVIPNYRWYSQYAIAWKETSYAYLIDNHFQKIIGYKALESCIEFKKFNLSLFCECCDIISESLTPTGDFKIVFEDDPMEPLVG